jgi:hypothetical protein
LQKERIGRLRDCKSAWYSISLLKMHELRSGGPIVSIKDLLSKTACKCLYVPMDVQKVMQVLQDLVTKSRANGPLPHGDDPGNLKRKVQID